MRIAMAGGRVTGSPRAGGHERRRPRPPAVAVRAFSQVVPDGVPVVRGAVHRQLAALFGPPPFDPRAAPGDPGLTGPGSASWRVIGEPAAIAGGIRGLLLQVAHPLAMAGVADHSAFRTDPLGRLQRTSGYVTTTTFGSTREALVVSQRVRRAHRRVVGTAPDGRPYRADDPHLLAWVSVALTSSFLAADATWAPFPVRRVEADRFVAEQSRIAALLDPRVDVDALLDDEDAHAALRAGQIQLPMVADGTLPTSVASLDEALAGFADDLGVNDQGREAVRFLRRPPIPVVSRAGYRVLFAGATATLTATERHALELDLSPIGAATARARTEALLMLLRVTSGTSPSERLAIRRAAGQHVLTEDEIHREV